MRYLWSLAILSTVLLCIACGEDDCYYCGKDITGGVSQGADVPVIPKDSDVPAADGYTDSGEDEDAVINDEITDADLLPTENMVLVEATTFMMGCEEDVDPDCADTKSTPRHEVSVPGFEIDVHEVTKGEYEACIESGVCANDPDDGLLLFKINDGENPFCVLMGASGASFPANCITWEGARTYCEWVGKRLPSEAEWELAARGDDENNYPWGDAPAPSCDNTVMEASDWGCDSGLSMPVGSKPEGVSPYGLYDMAGNVWEWVEDDWHEGYDDTGLATPRPDDGTAWVDAERPANRVIRGGSFMIGADEIFEFLSYAHYGSPAEDPGVSRGFRCAR